MEAIELTTTINTLASLMTETLSDDEIVLLSAVFTQLGDTLTTILAYKASNN